MRQGEAFSQAARAERTTLRTVRKHVGKQLKRGASGHYRATRNDTLRRDINVLGYDGYEPTVTRSSRHTHLASEHLIAIGRYLLTDDPKWLKPFIRKRVSGIELLTDQDRIHMLAGADLVKLDGLYRNHRDHRQK